MKWFVLGFVLAILIDVVERLILKPHGTLRIDHSNPEKDVYRFEINNLDSLNRKKRIVLKIDHHADLSQK